MCQSKKNKYPIFWGWEVASRLGASKTEGRILKLLVRLSLLCLDGETQITEIKFSAKNLTFITSVLPYPVPNEIKNLPPFKIFLRWPSCLNCLIIQGSTRISAVSEESPRKGTNGEDRMKNVLKERKLRIGYLINLEDGALQQIDILSSYCLGK